MQREGLVPLQREVSRGGKTFSQTFWTRPEDKARALRAMAKQQKRAEHQQIGRLSDAQKTAAREGKLKDIESKIVSEPIEHAHLIDEAGNVVLEKTGTKDAVEFTLDEAMQMKDKIFTHNHPMGRSLSPEDVGLAAKVNLKEIRAVGTNRFDGKVYVYSMSRKGDAWPEIDKISEAANWAQRHIKGEFEGKVGIGIMTVEEANARHHDEVWRRAAEHFEAVYTVKELT